MLIFFWLRNEIIDDQNGIIATERLLNQSVTISCQSRQISYPLKESFVCFKYRMEIIVLKKLLFTIIENLVMGFPFR